jgi:small subunit ribosomal protein S27e
MDIKCPSCQAISIGFSHSQSKITCKSCNKVLSKPTGGKAKLAEGVMYIKKK